MVALDAERPVAIDTAAAAALADRDDVISLPGVALPDGGFAESLAHVLTYPVLRPPVGVMIFDPAALGLPAVCSVAPLRFGVAHIHRELPGEKQIVGMTPSEPT
jgi:hypothetical protein